MKATTPGTARQAVRSIESAAEIRLVGVGVGSGTEHVTQYYPRSRASVPVADLGALADCVPDFDSLRLLDERPVLNLYPFVYERGSRTVRARCFGADLSGVEDPATGSAAGPLVAWLQDCLDIDRIVVEQGVEMGRPSRIEARMEAGRPVVSGTVTVLAEGSVRLPGEED